MYFVNDMVTKIQQAKKIMEQLNKLDAQYLVGFPKKLSNAEYKKKRASLRKKFVALKK